MGKQRYYFGIQCVLALSFLMPRVSLAEDIFIDCSNANAPQDQCAALYADQAFLPNAGDYQVVTAESAQIVAPNNINSANPDLPMAATMGQAYDVPGMGYEVPQQQIIMRDTAAPIAVSQPMDDTEDLGSEYAVYKTGTGSLILEREVTQEDADGATIRTTKTKETTVTPPYVEMPSISAHQRSGKLAYGDDVHDWEANNGDSLRALLIDWGQRSGWTVVWKLDRDYILEAGVVFRGNFTEVASAIIRTFARAIPAPIGTFYKGNRVLVINTQEDDNA